MEDSHVNKDILDNLFFQRNAIQLRYVELIDVSFNNLGSDEYTDLPFALHRHAEIEDDHANIFLTAEIGAKESTGFTMTIKYKGEVYSTIEIDDEQLKNYALQNVVPMLLPYVREVSSSLISRTNLPNFTLPTLDVINYLKSISEDEQTD